MLKTVLATLLALALSAQASPRESKFLWISDLHFNSMADPMLVKDLQTTEFKEWEPILERTEPRSFSLYGSDTNWWLLKSALQQFPATLRRPAFIMVTGDLLAHRFHETFKAVTHDTDEEHYRAFVLKTTQFLAWEMRQRFPGTKIFITPGNNDNDCGDYTIVPDGTYLSDTAPIAKELAGGDDEFASAWKSLGSFDVAHPTSSNVRIISINSIFFSQLYDPRSSSEGCKQVDSNGGSDLLRWLSSNLEAAKRDGKQVWLMFHIPPGIDGYATAMKNDSLIVGGAADNEETCAQAITPMWKLDEKSNVDWTKDFDSLLANYSGTVVAGFAAHIHSDDFRLIGAAGEDRKFVLLDPAISPVYGQNPGFRVVSYKSDGAVTDQTTYYLTNLTCASSTTKGKWKQEYTFTRQWKAQSLDAVSLSSIYRQVVADPTAREQWLKNFAVLGPTEQQEKRFVRALYCADEGLSVDQYKGCYCGAAGSH